METNLSDEALEKIEKYRIRADKLFENAKIFLDKKEYEKTGEFLWGALATYINAIVYLKTGEAKHSHKKLVTAGEGIAKAAQDQDLFKAIKGTGQELHANYYHGFLEVEAFQDIFPEIEKAIEKLDNILLNELKGIPKIPAPPPEKVIQEN
jgi:hypothetical protein